MFLTTFDKKMYEDAIRMDATADGLERGMKQGLEQGLEQKLRSIVEKKLKRGDSVEKIADDLMEEVETVQKIVEQLKA